MTLEASSQTAGIKRPFQPEDQTTPQAHSDIGPDAPDDASLQTSAAVTSTFRNVSACNRCRVRKNKCDQRLPACTACEKAHTRCVGFDPITKKEIPRSYVYFLETRMLHLEALLIEHKIPFEPADAFEGGSKSRRTGRYSQSHILETGDERDDETTGSPAASHNENATKQQDDEKIDRIVSDIGMVSVQGASERRYLGSTSGISFARIVLAAIKSSVPATNGEASGSRADVSPSRGTAPGSSSLRDSYFGLSVRPTIKEATFPDKDLAIRLVNLYFEHANPQIPILHRTEFMELFDHAYSAGTASLQPRQLYLLNIVFAIGAGVIFGSSDSDVAQGELADMPAKRARLASQQAQPEEYHASAIVHLNSFFTASGASDAPDRNGGDMEDLQAVLLLAGFALLRPVAPGLWYIVGVAMRLAIDLGLHFEDGTSLDSRRAASRAAQSRSRGGIDHQERGRREWTRDMRRRLWWSTYCFDRLVSTCVGRPFGISDSVVTTEFPNLLDDKYITRTGFSRPLSPVEPSYKHVAHHYLRLRLLQSEILQVLQYQQAQQARIQGSNKSNQFVHKDIPSQFLIRHQDFRSWRSNVDQRLWEWKESAPQRNETGVAFSPQFLELNYWQAVIMLYRNSLSVPEPLAGELSPTEEVSTPTSPPVEDKEDQDLVFLKCAEAGQKTLRLYRQLHRRRLVNYTYLATHHLFMAGISFLYAVWHSPVVRSRLTIDDFDFTVLAATSVLGDLMEKCPPAKACRDAFERMSKATVQMCMHTPGFKLGQGAEPTSNNSSPTFPSTHDALMIDVPSQQRTGQISLDRAGNRRPPPQFDMDLHELFPDDHDMARRPSVVLDPKTSRAQYLQNPQQQRYAGQSQSSYFSNRGSRVRTGSNVESRVSRNSRTGPSSFQSAPSVSQQIPAPNAANNVHPITQANYTPYFNINQNSYNPDFMSNMPGMEFLNHLGSGGSNSGHPNTTSNPAPATNTGGPSQSQNFGHGPSSPAGGSGVSVHSQSPGFHFSYDNSNPGDSPSLMRYDSFDLGTGDGFDFGLGMGLDFNAQNGWTDPQQSFDLDGFFFGGGANGS